MGNFEEEEKQIQPSYLIIKLFKDISDHPDQVDHTDPPQTPSL